MKKKTHRVKKHYKKLPPHTWEAHTTASHGEVNKQLIIGIITILAVVVLASLLFFTDVFVGQAITPAPESILAGQAGIFLSENEINAGETMIIPVHAYLPAGKESTVVKFELSYPSDKMEVINCNDLYASLDNLFIVNGEDFSVVKNPTPCSSLGKIVFEFAALTDGDHVIKGLQKITDIPFKIKKNAPITSLPATLTFGKLEVYDLDTNEKISLNINHPDIKIGEAIDDSTCTDNSDCCNTLGECTPYEFCDLTFSPQGDEIGKCEPAICIENGDIGLDYSKKGSVTANHMLDPNYLIEDNCKDDTILVETSCTAHTPKIDEYDCSFEGLVCEDGACTESTDDCSPDDVEACDNPTDCAVFGGEWDVNVDLCRTELFVPEIKVELINSAGKTFSESLVEGEITKVVKDEEYDVIVTISPETDLPDNHLVFITIKSGAEIITQETKAMFYDTKPSLLLASGEVEVVKFNYKPSETGIITVSALVWGNWPSSGTGNYLVQKKEVKYEAK
jgi:hypothetical protein